MKWSEILEHWRGGLIVSCQAAAGSPLARPDIIAALAHTAALSGAVGLRLDGADNIRATCAVVNLPVLGIEKCHEPASEVYITPTFASAARIAAAGADVIALDATPRPRPKGLMLRDLVAQIHTELHKPVMADVATLEQGLAAAEFVGVAVISTTLAGYTRETQGLSDSPDFHLVESLAHRLTLPIICEGRLRSPDDVRRAFDCGAHAVVVGAALTGVDWLVRQYVAATLGKGEK